MRALLENSGWLAAIAFDAAGARLAALDRRGRVFVWECNDGKLAGETTIPWKTPVEDRPLSIAFAPNGELFVAGPYVLSVLDGRTLAILREEQYVSADRLCFGDGGAFVLAGEKVYDAKTLQYRGAAAADDVPFVRWRVGCAALETDSVLLGDDGGFDDSGLTGTSPLREDHLTLLDPKLVHARRKYVLPKGSLVQAATFDAVRRRFVFVTSRGELVTWSADGASEERHERSMPDLRAIYCFDDASAAIASSKRELLWWPGFFEGVPTRVALPAESRLALVDPRGRWLATVGIGKAALLLDDLSLRELPRRTLPRVTFAQLRVLGIEWPLQAEKALRAEHGAVDVDATLRALEGQVAYAKRTLSEMYGFARTWGAPVDETTDRREEMVDLAREADAALVCVKEIRRAILALPSLPDAATAAVATADTDLDRLKRAILAAPEDDAPRLAYADALPAGDDRATLIRGQCEAEKLPSWSPRRARLEAWARWAVRRHAEQWERPIAPYAKGCIFERGFVHALVVDPYHFAKDADAIFELEPVRELRFSGSAFDLPESPALARIRAIQSRDADPGPIVRSPHVRAVRSLEFDESEDRWYGGKEPAWYGVLANGGNWRALESLSLWSVKALALGLPTLARGTELGALRELVIRGSELGAAPWQAFGRSELGARLESLSVQLFSAEDASGLARGNFHRLRELRIDGYVSGIQLAELVPLASHAFESVEKLELTSIGFDTEACRAFAARTRSLTELRLATQTASVAAVAPLVAAAQSGLRMLEVNLRDMTGFGAILASSEAKRLELLRVGASITAADVDAILADHAPAAFETIGDPAADVAARLASAGFGRKSK